MKEPLKVIQISRRSRSFYLLDGTFVVGKLYDTNNPVEGWFKYVP